MSINDERRASYWSVRNSLDGALHERGHITGDGPAVTIWSSSAQEWHVLSTYYSPENDTICIDIIEADMEEL